MFLVKISYKYNLSFAFIIRLLLIIYGEFHDKYSEVPFTDVDYRVFTDASRHVWNLGSPYDRHTYRYSPILAILMLPNILLNGCFGKILFSIIDITVGLLIRNLVIFSRKNYINFKENLEKEKILPIKEKTCTNDKEKKRKNTKNKKKCKYDLKTINYDHVPDYCMLFWIYNPMSIIISTRGNCDTLAVFLVLLTLYLLQIKQNYFISGLIHGLAVHFRLYPILYSLSYFMYLSNFSKFDIDGKNSIKSKDTSKAIEQDTKDIDNSDTKPLHDSNIQLYETNNKVMIVNDSIKKERRTIFKKKYLHYLLPNKDQMYLVLGSITSVIFLTSIFYYFYGYKFLYETYVYHLIRKDTRHNFSLFFYLQYLTAGVKNIGIWQKVLTILPQVVLLVVLSVRYGLNKFTLHFSLLTQTIVMVSYNSVLTSQYFIWILGIMPLVLWQIDMTFSKAGFLAAIWFVAQLAWLLPAYLLEFHGQNTFLFVWLQGVSFFCANMAVLGRLVKCFMYKTE